MLPRAELQNLVLPVEVQSVASRGAESDVATDVQKPVLQQRCGGNGPAEVQRGW